MAGGRRQNRRHNLINVTALATAKNAVKTNNVQNKLQALLSEIRGREELRYVDMIYSKHLISKMRFSFSNEMLLRRQKCEIRFTINDDAVLLQIIFVNSKYLLSKDSLLLKFNLPTANSLHDYALIS